MAEVVLQGVSHVYAGAQETTVTDLDLRIASGSRHALLGSSGAGKTTLLNMLSGLEVPSAGQILIDGRDVSGSPPGERNLTQVFQFPVLYESLNVAKNLQFPLKTRGYSAAEQRRRGRDIAELLGITALLPRKPSSLSLFQKQLVAIGRALVRPDVALVLLDEPLTAVEPAIKWQLRRVLKQVQGELDATMIYVTHDQTEALTFADRVSVLHQGKILQTDTPAGLVNKPSHEYVASFIGTPGMNLVPGEVRDASFVVADHMIAEAGSAQPGPCMVGFRPDWAAVVRPPARGIPVEVLGVRTMGVKARRPVGIVTARLPGAPAGGAAINVRQNLDVSPGEMGVLQVRRVVGFRYSRRMPSGGNDRSA